MKEQLTYLDENNQYPIIFTLNVMKSIQEKYGTLEDWQNLIFVKDKKKDEPDIEPDINALLFGLTEMVNEGIDILNEESNEQTPIAFKTEKQVGRVITKLGLEGATEKLGQSILKANKTDNPKNE